LSLLHFLLFLFLIIPLGVYFDDICLAIDEQYSVYQLHLRSQPLSTEGGKSKAEEKPISTIDSIRADLSAHWTMIYQSADIIIFLSLSIFPYAGVLTIHQMILVLSCVGILTSILGFTFTNVNTQQREFSWNEVYKGLVAVPRQLKRDARVSLLAPFVFGFGITTGIVPSAGLLFSFSLSFSLSLSLALSLSSFSLSNPLANSDVCLLCK
jgi:hypothetical protein